MPLPEFDEHGYLPPGIHTASFREVRERFGIGTDARLRQIDLLEQIVEAASKYRSIKRVLVWGSFATAKDSPGDLDYSIVVSVDHRMVPIARQHRRFFAQIDARMQYGVDKAYLIIADYPLDYYAGKLDALCTNRDDFHRGIIEISIWGRYLGEWE